MMLRVEDKGLIFKTKLFLSFEALATVTKKSWSIGSQCFICRHNDLF